MNLPTIYKFADPRVPQMVFEWHPQTGKVYRVDIPGQWIDGVYLRAESGTAKASVIAENPEHHASAYGFVQTYVRGYLRFFEEQQSLTAPQEQAREQWLNKIPQPKRTIVQLTA